MQVKDLSQELLLGTCIPINVVNSNLVIPHGWTSTIHFVVLQVVAKEDPRARTSVLLQHYQRCIVQFVNGISLKQLRSKLIFNSLSLEKTPLRIRAEFQINHLNNRQPQYIYIVLSTCAKYLFGFHQNNFPFFSQSLLESMIS